MLTYQQMNHQIFSGLAEVITIVGIRVRWRIDVIDESVGQSVGSIDASRFLWKSFTDSCLMWSEYARNV